MSSSISQKFHKNDHVRITREGGLIKYKGNELKLSLGKNTRKQGSWSMTGSKESNHEKLISDYKAAYRAANGSDIKITYTKGWYCINDLVAKRGREIVMMTDTLNKRAGK